MNLDLYPTANQLRQLLASVDDNAGDHLLYVTQNGDVHLEPVGDDTSAGFVESIPDLQFSMERFTAGSGYAGPVAVNDEEYIDEMLEDLQMHWFYKTVGHADVDTLPKDLSAYFSLPNKQ